MKFQLNWEFDESRKPSLYVFIKYWAAKPTKKKSEDPLKPEKDKRNNEIKKLKLVSYNCTRLYHSTSVLNYLVFSKSITLMSCLKHNNIYAGYMVVIIEALYL